MQLGAFPGNERPAAASAVGATRTVPGLLSLFSSSQEGAWAGDGILIPVSEAPFPAVFPHFSLKNESRPGDGLRATPVPRPAAHVLRLFPSTFLRLDASEFTTPTAPAAASSRQTLQEAAAMRRTNESTRVDFASTAADADLTDDERVAWEMSDHVAFLAGEEGLKKARIGHVADKLGLTWKQTQRLWRREWKRIPASLVDRIRALRAEAEGAAEHDCKGHAAPEMSDWHRGFQWLGGHLRVLLEEVVRMAADVAERQEAKEERDAGRFEELRERVAALEVEFAARRRSEDQAGSNVGRIRSDAHGVVDRGVARPVSVRAGEKIVHRAG